jgi:hypothetical protein
MKKVFKITESKIAPARQIDSFKHEINKYIARERRKKLPEGVDFWDFDCKIGNDSESAEVIHLSEINKAIDSILTDTDDSFYIEVLAKPGKRIKKIS